MRTDELISKSLVLFLVSGLWILVSLATPHETFGLEEDVQESPDQIEHRDHSQLRWSYKGFQGPRFWGFLEDAFKACRVGHEQSPIDVVFPHHPDHQEELKFHYFRAQFIIATTKHGVHFLASGNSWLSMNKRIYRLKQFHFHDPSEHHIQGKEFPLEMHLVHEDASGRLLVVAVFFGLGKNNRTLDAVLSANPQSGQPRTIQHGRHVIGQMSLDVRDLLPRNVHHFSYHGSLTTPPCTQGIQWIVMQRPLQLSSSQLDLLKTMYGVNARPVQPLYNRKIQGY